MKKIRNILTLALSGLFLAGFLLAAILTPDRTDSLSERRKLAQRPALRASAVADGTYMTAFEKYTLDQFPLRDSFRALKAFFSGDILRQLDNNGVYAAGGHLAKRRSGFPPYMKRILPVWARTFTIALCRIRTISLRSKTAIPPWTMSFSPIRCAPG